MNKKEILNIFETIVGYANGQGWIKVENNQIVGYEPYIGKYSIDLKKRDDELYRVLVSDGNIDLPCENADDVVSTIDWIYSKRRHGGVMSSIANEEVCETLSLEDLKVFPELTDDEKLIVLDHMKNELVMPSKVYEDMDDYYYFWLIENNIYTTKKQVVEQFASQLKVGSIKTLDSGKIVAFK